MSYVNCCFFFNDTATTEIYTYVHTLSLHDALPICGGLELPRPGAGPPRAVAHAAARPREGLPDLQGPAGLPPADPLRDHPEARSEEHTSELQSLMRISYAVFCLKKKKKTVNDYHIRASQTKSKNNRHILYHT